MPSFFFYLVPAVTHAYNIIYIGIRMVSRADVYYIYNNNNMACLSRAIYYLVVYGDWTLTKDAARCTAEAANIIYMFIT